MAKSVTKAPEQSFSEFGVRRDSISSYFDPPLPRSTFHDLVNKGSIVPLKGIRGFYLLNASLRRLGLREVRALPNPPAKRSMEDLLRLAFAVIDPVKADLKTKLILKTATTPANTHDSQVFKELVDERDRAVLADSAYHSEEHEAYLLTIGAEEFLMRKATRRHPLSAVELQTNHTVSRMRVRVEHVFARMRRTGADLCRSIGLKRATQHDHLSNLVHSMDRYSCLMK